MTLAFFLLFGILTCVELIKNILEDENKCIECITILLDIVMCLFLTHFQLSSNCILELI